MRRRVRVVGVRVRVVGVRVGFGVIPYHQGWRKDVAVGLGLM